MNVCGPLEVQKFSAGCASIARGDGYLTYVRHIEPRSARFVEILDVVVSVVRRLGLHTNYLTGLHAWKLVDIDSGSDLGDAPDRLALLEAMNHVHVLSRSGTSSLTNLRSWAPDEEEGMTPLYARTIELADHAMSFMRALGYVETPDAAELEVWFAQAERLLAAEESNGTSRSVDDQWASNAGHVVRRESAQVRSLSELDLKSLLNVSLVASSEVATHTRTPPSDHVRTPVIMELAAGEFDANEIALIAERRPVVLVAKVDLRFGRPPVNDSMEILADLQAVGQTLHGISLHLSADDVSHQQAVALDTLEAIVELTQHGAQPDA